MPERAETWETEAERTHNATRFMLDDLKCHGKKRDALPGETTTTTTTSTTTTTTTTTSSTEEGFNASNLTVEERLAPLDLSFPLDVPSCYDRRHRLMPGPWLDCDVDYTAHICFKDLCNDAQSRDAASPVSLLLVVAACLFA